MDTAVSVPGRGLYVFSGNHVWRYTGLRRAPDPGYPKPITSEFPGAFQRDLDAALLHPDGSLYLFRGNQHIRYDVGASRPELGYPRPYAPDWPGVFPDRIDAALTWAPDIIYLFRDDDYTSFSLRQARTRPGYPKPIPANWPGLRGGPVRAAFTLPGERTLLLTDEASHLLDAEGRSLAPGPGEAPVFLQAEMETPSTSQTYDSVRQNFMAFSTTFEGRVQYMYTDVCNFVTVGIGNKIDPIGQALDLPFVFKDPPYQPGTKEDKAADWHAVKNYPTKGLKAPRNLTKLMLTDDVINSLVLSQFARFESTLRKTSEFASLGTWPADAQLGLMSMAWAMGPGFGTLPGHKGWPNFRSACSRQDWAAAAANSHMDETGNPGLASRNAANRVLFLNAAYAVSHGWDLSVLRYTISGSRATVRSGSSGSNVTFLQTRLQALGYTAAASGQFDDATTQAVMRFQADNQLKVDGIVGLVSWAALGTCVPASGTS
jgi:GH24 family phage-related lysozyme (muramidase)